MSKSKMIFTGLLLTALFLLPTDFNHLAARGGGHGGGFGGGGDFGGDRGGYGDYGRGDYGDYNRDDAYRSVQDRELYNELNDYSGYDSGYSTPTPSYYNPYSPSTNPYVQAPNMDYSPSLDNMPINPPSPSDPTGQ